MKNGWNIIYINPILYKGGDEEEKIDETISIVHKGNKDKPGYYVYRFLNQNNEVLYIGKTKQLRQRIYQHVNKRSNLDPKCIDELYYIHYLEFSNECDMSIYETYLINYYQPKYNIDVKASVGNIRLPLPKTWNAYNKDDLKIEPQKVCINNNIGLFEHFKFDYNIFTNYELEQFLSSHINCIISTKELKRICEICQVPMNNINEINQKIWYNNAKVYLTEENNQTVLREFRGRRQGYGSIFMTSKGLFEFKVPYLPHKRKSFFGHTRTEIAQKVIKFMNGIQDGI